MDGDELIAVFAQALEARASEAKETYASDMAAYKYTKEYQDYEEYLVG